MRYTRRLLLALLWLILFDQAVPPLLERAERHRYEGTTAFRFEDSDVFGLGPLVEYLREHPAHERRRVVFFGNSIVFGYGVRADDTIAAKYERLTPNARVYNMGINGQQAGSGYLVTKDILDSVDLVYFQAFGGTANEMLPSLIPVAESDLAPFRLTAPNGAETRLQTWLGRVWKLYRYNYRLQAALFGTSTRVYLYLHTRHNPAEPKLHWPPAIGHPSLRAPRAPGPIPTARKLDKMKLELARLTRARGKRIVFIDYSWGMPHERDADVAAFNAAFAPFAETVIIEVPRGITYDGTHPVPAAAQEIAQLLIDHERAEGFR